MSGKLTGEWVMGRCGRVHDETLALADS